MAQNSQEVQRNCTMHFSTCGCFKDVFGEKKAWAGKGNLALNGFGVVFNMRFCEILKTQIALLFWI